MLQGLGGALLLPVGRLALLRTVPRAEFLAAMSFVAIPGLIGPLLGPTLGGWLVQYASWHWIFLINVPVGLAGCIATLKLMPDLRGALQRPFDGVGYAMLAFGMVAISLALDGVSELGLRQAGVLLLLVFGFASLTAYWLHALRRPDPLFEPSLLRHSDAQHRPARQPVLAPGQRLHAFPDPAAAPGLDGLFAAAGRG